MCGILCTISAAPRCSPPPVELLDLLRARGPDSLEQATGHLKAFHAGHISSQSTILSVSCWSSVLSLRGEEITKQPLNSLGQISDRSDPCAAPILCWNGEIWAYEKRPLPLGACDTTFLYEQLRQASVRDHVARSSDSVEEEGLPNNLVQVLDKIEGPFSIVFLDHLNGRLYFGRDRTGRRSLLTKFSDTGELNIASVGDGSSGWTELDAGCIHQIEISTNSDLPASEQDGAYIVSSIGPVQLRHSHHRSEALSFNSQVPSKTEPGLDAASPSLNRLKELLHQSLIPRLRTLSTAKDQNTTRFAVLFSGGLDCTTLARMMHDILPVEEPIDLLNVAFENPRTASRLDSSQTYTSCPDRGTALSSHTELMAVCPSRCWRLVLIDVPYTETLQHRPMIKKLMHPHGTEMDLSIASALYFAARGEGRVFGPPSTTTAEEISGTYEQYRSPARILISGLGADELFAGYQRHATAFARGLKSAGREAAYKALLAELELDYRRLGARNLGRDDRVLSHWGRECRFPFLDESLVAWAVTADVQDKCGFNETCLGPSEADDTSIIEPGKKVLRLVAESLGLHRAARERKRAMQFGARSAKMERGQTRGTDAVRDD